ncbi:TetR/AcrR family transcriptional regulator [Actinophytocola algeriensis]|uniref:AcrR family transcriptional regulator n=1 Tax=Actinophytocola algeriensis TaxID=1768010 RepID=A0A7W7VGU8_9PSEU|nr:TetR/AcrR family transcriptional regulator [Actinophytocola algeriensis]MBB4909718.1 AcrR family transcriptional regulator [Actinophytocola algeriensis]MBE1475708.1 AcrR family transcriptional regulator [Actinophytocola algeriensis]
MARWEPNAQERLTQAALELFVGQGYDRTTVAEITDRAGLTKRTFFRHYADKREVLFLGQDQLTRLFTDAIKAAPTGATPLDAVTAALESAAAVFGQDRREFVRQRQSVIDANDDLRERELLKLARLTAAMATALRERGVADPTAGLAAEVGSLAFVRAFERWVSPSCEEKFATLAREALAELKAAAATLA